jgi:methyl-accepting chemotaxis protein
MRIEEIVAEVQAECMPVIRAAQDAARDISAAFEAAIQDSAAKLDDFITIDYKPVPGTNPIQYVTKATAIYDRVLPSVIERGRRRVPECVYFVAVDRNAYLPCHHPEYDQKQKPNQYDWNDLNARGRRIMERSQTLAAARNTREFAVNLYVRDMRDGTKLRTKVVVAPIMIRSELWGNILAGIPLK